MAKRRYPPEEVVNKLREADVLIANGKSILEACKAIEVTDQTYYRWRREYGGLKLDQVKRIRELEQENTRLRKAVSDLTLDKQILKEVAEGKF
jgi:transposase-like protein